MWNWLELFNNRLCCACGRYVILVFGCLLIGTVWILIIWVCMVVVVGSKFFVIWLYEGGCFVEWLRVNVWEMGFFWMVVWLVFIGIFFLFWGGLCEIWGSGFFFNGVMLFNLVDLILDAVLVLFVSCFNEFVELIGFLIDCFWYVVL